MKTPDCTEAQQWIVEDLDEGLVGDRRAALEAHLRGCDSCREMRDRTERLFVTLADDVPPDPGEEFWTEYDSSLEARILQNGCQEGSGMRWKIAALALAAGLAFLVVWVGNFHPFAGKPATGEAALPVVIEELQRVYGPVSDDGSEIQVTVDATLTAANVPVLRSDTVAEWVASEYDPLMMWL